MDGMRCWEIDDKGMTMPERRIEELEAQLADTDAMLATHAFTIDKSDPNTWPKNSTLRAACARHALRSGTVVRK